MKPSTATTSASWPGSSATSREGLGELQARFERVMRDVRRLPGGEHVYQRVDAYPGIRLDRDMGAVTGAAEWIGEVLDIPRAGEGEARRRRRATRDIERAQALRPQGESLYAIAMATGRSKEWLRSHAGITD